jgi:hypothetical protein
VHGCLYSPSAVWQLNRMTVLGPVSERECYIHCRRVPARPDPKSSPFRCLSMHSMRLKEFADCHDKKREGWGTEMNSSLISVHGSVVSRLV